MPRSSVAARFENVAQLLEQLGGIDPSRIRLDPPPGQATEKDLLWLHDRTNRLYELVDGVLVEKAMGYLEGSVANWISFLLQNFLNDHDLGNLAGADATVRLMPGLVRIPDLSFVRWKRFPVRGQIPRTPIPDLAPDLAVEVLSEGNTPGEITRKLKEYFLCGTTLVWLVGPRSRTVQVYTAPDQAKTLREGETLDGGEVLPGLKLSVEQICIRVMREEPASGSKKKRSPRRKK
jgi:Uma2 family endonuclease